MNSQYKEPIDIKICLNGLWSFAPGDGSLEAIPDVWESTPIIVPSPWNVNSFAAPYEDRYLGETYVLRGGEYDLFPEYPAAWDKADSGWYQTRFFAAPAWKGYTVELKFEAVHFYSEYYINGQKVASDMDGFLPYTFDITPYLHYGEENILTVGVKKLDLFKTQISPEIKKFEYGTGSFWGGHIAGIWQDVFLLVSPSMHIDDVFVQTDTDHQMITVDVGVVNAKPGYVLHFQIQDLQSGDTYVLGTALLDTVDATSRFSYDYSGMQDKIRLWWPHSPSLYMLQVQLAQGEDIVHSKEVRFGFRSFGSKGNRFILNGKPINLRNDSWHYMGFAYQTEAYTRAWYKMAQDAHVNCIRLHAQVYPEFFLDIADEMGMLIIDESAIWASHCQFHYSERFIENGIRHLERLVKRDRNHPSVIIWSIENECIPAYRVHGDSAVKNEEELNQRLIRFSDCVKALDPTRMTSADGSFDLGGRMDIVSLHYPTRENTAKTDKPITIGEMGSMYYSSPDCVAGYLGEKVYKSFDGRLEALGQEAFEDLKEHRKWAAQICIFNLVWYGLYPLPIKEKILQYDDYRTPGVKPSKIGPYISTLNAGYDDTLPDYLPNPVFHWVEKAYIPERFFFEDRDSRFYPGTQLHRKLSVFNDSLEEHEYTLAWRLYDGNDKGSAGSITINVPAAEYREVNIPLELPADHRVESYTLQVTMSDDRGPVFTESCLLKVHGAEVIAAGVSDRKDIIFADAGQWLREQLSSSKNIHFCNSSELDETGEIYVLCADPGDDIFQRLIKSKKSILDISRSSRYFMQWAWKNPVAGAFFNVTDSGLRSGLEEEGLRHWEKEWISDYSMSDYINANALHLMVNGKGTPLVSEFLEQDARIILSALDLNTYASCNPSAFQLLVNLVNYLITRETPMLHTLVVAAEENSQLVRFLKTLNVQYTLLPNSSREDILLLGQVETLLVDGDKPLDFISNLTSRYVKTLVIWGMSADTLPMALKGRLEVGKTPLNQLMRAADAAAVEGMHAGDLYGLEAGNEMAVVQKPIILRDKSFAQGLLKNTDINWLYWNLQGEDKKTAAILRNEKSEKQDMYGLVKLQLNGMQVYISQWVCNPDNYKSKKLACTLLTNLGVRIETLEIDAFETIVNEGIYDQQVQKALVLGPVTDVRMEELIPGFNHEMNGLFWRMSDNQAWSAKGKFVYGLYVFSPSDRTDLLLNPDLVGVEVQSRFAKESYLNGEMISEGQNIKMNALQLKAGWNCLILIENRSDEQPDKLRVAFHRKDDRPLDLSFSLQQPGSIPIPDRLWEMTSNFHLEDCNKAIQGRGIMWDSVESQCRGMYFAVDLKEVCTVTRLQFNSKILKSDHIQWNTPRCFTVYSSMNGEQWVRVCQVGNESSLTLVDGKLIMNFIPFSARYIKIELDDVANKRWMISELKVFRREG